MIIQTEKRLLLVIPRSSFITLFNKDVILEKEILHYPLTVSIFKEDFFIDLDDLDINIFKLTNSYSTFYINFVYNHNNYLNRFKINFPLNFVYKSLAINFYEMKEFLNKLRDYSYIYHTHIHRSITVFCDFCNLDIISLLIYINSGINIRNIEKYENTPCLLTMSQSTLTTYLLILSNMDSEFIHDNMLDNSYQHYIQFFNPEEYINKYEFSPRKKSLILHKDYLNKYNTNVKNSSKFTNKNYKNRVINIFGYLNYNKYHSFSYSNIYNSFHNLNPFKFYFNISRYTTQHKLYKDIDNLNLQLNDLNTKNIDEIWPKNIYDWRNYKSEIFYEIIRPQDLEYELKKFINTLKSLDLDIRYIAIIFKICLPTSNVRSCSSAQIYDVNHPISNLLNIFNYIFLLEDFLDAISEDPDNYASKEEAMQGKIIFTFKILKDSNLKSKYENVLKKRYDSGRGFAEGVSPVRQIKLHNFNLPSSMGIDNWPNFGWIVKDKMGKSYYTFKEKSLITKIDFDIHIVDCNSYFVIAKNGTQVLFTLKDEKDSSKPNHIFKRTIFMDGRQYVYLMEDGEVKCYFKSNKTHGIISNIKKEPYYKPKILTLDIETRVVNGEHIPICIAIFDGSYVFYKLFNEKDWRKDMMEFFYNTIFNRKYSYYKIYVHNLSNFDIIFILDSISKIGKVNILKRDSKFLKVRVAYKSSPKQKVFYSLSFYDSFLILPNSLKSLSKSFNVETPKSVFPFLFLNSETFDVNYKGKVPPIELFGDSFGKLNSKDRFSNYTEYKNNYCNKDWVLRKELYDYCKIDCIALYQIIHKFHKLIHNLFKVDITKYPTLPSIAFAIYRSNFLEECYEIPKILSHLHYTLKQSYFGGFTESYKPIGENIRSYDINSLYPYSMKSFYMPVGKPVYFSGDASKYKKDIFGFFKVKVNCPENIDKPTLPVKYKTSNGYRTIFPVGTWTGWYFSEELKDKIIDGYKFEILEGYLFDKYKIFDGYIGELYKIKSSTDRKDPLYQISKLLLNSLYGRFGLNPEFNTTEIVSTEESEKIVINKNNVDITPLYSGNVLVSYEESNSDETLNLSSNISVSISSAIAAYSRITMSHFIRKYNKNIYYIDTDGIKIDCDLEDDETDSKELGKFKYEYMFSHAVFPGPKVYGGFLNEIKGDQYDIIKVKGLKKRLNYLHLKYIINRNNTYTIYHEKWFKSIKDSKIYIQNNPYKLKLNENKREFIFDSQGFLINTKPFILKNGVIFKRDNNIVHYLPKPKLNDERHYNSFILKKKEEFWKFVKTLSDKFRIRL